MELKEGMDVKCKINGKEIVGVLHKEYDENYGEEAWFLCQDECNGCVCEDRKGFNYSWRLGFISDEEFIIRYYNIKPAGEKPKTGSVREFEGGATRDTEEGKVDYEGFISPIVMLAYGRYMHSNRIQSDGKLRDSDNWQKHFGEDHYKVCIKSLYRHFMDLMLHHRGFNDLAREDIMEALGGIMFNTIAYWDKYLKDSHEDTAYRDELQEWLDGINGRKI